jgi:hypothetical protein
MRVVAAKFPGRREASAARELLQRELDPKDVEVASLAHPGEAPVDDALLAGRFTDDQAPRAVELVESAGGEVVADVDERWTGMSSTSLDPPNTIH